MNNNHLTLEASFTPDSKYIMSGIAVRASWLMYCIKSLLTRIDYLGTIWSCNFEHY